MRRGWLVNKFVCEPTATYTATEGTSLPSQFLNVTQKMTNYREETTLLGISPGESANRIIPERETRYTNISRDEPAWSF